jgi:hypothetical protein
VPKFNVKRVTFTTPRACLGGSSWMADIKQGGVQSAEFDEGTRMLTLNAPSEKIRIPAEGVAEMVYGATRASADV